VDIVVAQGWEAGGHVRGQVGTLPLAPAVVDAVAPTPVVAAGGIADSRGLAAALALGAVGVWLGTRFLASAEAVAHRRYQESLVQAAETDTCYATLFDGGWTDAPQRTLRTATVRAWEAAGRPLRGQRPGEGDIVARDGAGRPVRRYDDRLPDPALAGDIEAVALYAGQSAGLIHQVQPAGEIVRHLAAEAAQAFARTACLIQSGRL
jgi:NAD(P)H-dependent flavin oxidoreductase YrpB (nitropropane dioxygenase family)